jgi:DeoR family fructose operon transcriptional repressor
VILVADSRKIGTRSFAYVGSLEQLDVLVTDEGIDERAAASLARHGITVIKA